MSRVKKTWKNYNLEKTHQAETLILQQVVKDISVIVANPLKQARQILSNVEKEKSLRPHGHTTLLSNRTQILLQEINHTFILLMNRC